MCVMSFGRSTSMVLSTIATSNRWYSWEVRLRMLDIAFQATLGNRAWTWSGTLPMYSAALSTSFASPALVTGSAAQSSPRRARPSIASCALRLA